MYEYEDFITEMVKALKERFPEKEITLKEVQKNNQTLDGIVVRTPGDAVCPTIYLDGYYDKYCDEGFQPVVDAVSEAIERADREKPDIDIGWLKDPEYCKSKLICRLVRGDNNEKYLSERPHRATPFGEVVMYLNVGETETQIQSIGVTDQLYDAYLEKYFPSIDDAFDYAMSNTMEQFPPKVQSMATVLREIIAKQFGVEPQAEEFLGSLEEGEQMYVLSNSSTNGGAVALVYPENLQKIANEMFGGRDLIVLPSSIHEAILVEPRGDMGPREVLAMVKDVNENQVPPEEVLADDAFYYKAATREVVRATDLIKEMEKKKEKSKDVQER